MSKLFFEQLEERANPSSVTIVGNDIVVDGNAGDDAIYVNATNPAAVNVRINGVNLGNYALPAGGHIIVNGLDGRDNIQCVGSVSFEVHGGAGKDTITGGNGNDVIYGEAGEDNIQGGGGNDVLVGGAGVDFLSGGSGDDVLIGGSVGAAYDYAALRAVSDNWAASQAVDAALVATVVDTEQDRLTGGLTPDWFIKSNTDVLPDVAGNDTVTGV